VLITTTDALTLETGPPTFTAPLCIPATAWFAKFCSSACVAAELDEVVVELSIEEALA
jgi:hypothetical protein